MLGTTCMLGTPIHVMDWSSPPVHRYELSWLNLDDQFPQCRKSGNDLLCSYDAYTSNSSEYFNRNAYHMFAAISATRDVKALTADAILKVSFSSCRRDML